MQLKKITILALFLNSTTCTSNLYKAIAQENLKSFKPQELTHSSDALSNLINDNKDFKTIVYEKLNEQLNPTNKTKRDAVFSLLSKHEESHSITSTTILDQRTWSDLNLLCGNPSEVSLYLAQQLDRAATEIGRITLYKKLIQPTDDIAQLQQQQNIVKELVNNENLFNKLAQEIKKAAQAENALLSFWKDDFFSALFTQSDFRLPFAKKYKKIKELNNIINKNESIVVIRDNLTLLQQLASLGAMATSTVSLPLGSFLQSINHPYAQKVEGLNRQLGVRSLSLFSLTGACCYVMSFLSKNKNFQTTNDIVAAFISGVFTWQLIKNTCAGYAINYCTQTKLLEVAHYFNSLTNMINILHNYPTIVEQFSTIKEYEQKLRELNEKCDDFNHLTKLLSTKTFKRDKASYFAHWGRISAAYRIILDIKDELIPLMMMIGEIDAQLSIAQLYKEFQDKNIKFCFPTYVNQEQMPHLEIKDFWNPFVNSQKAVTNSLRLGKEQQQNIIITGPNAAGKSTTVKGLMINIILAQSFGIAAAQELTFTPFSNIITYLNISDDLAAGNSRFVAEAKRARNLLDVLNKVNNSDKFSIMAADELFNGTTYKEGQAAAYSLIKQLGSSKNNICIACTHFPKLTELEERTAHFANYKVAVNYDDEGKINYPYTLTRGTTDQIVTFDILKEEGFGDTFLTEAKNMLIKKNHVITSFDRKNL